MLFTYGLFTSESVSEGHPDKLADQISDAVLDAFLAREPSARVACETLLADQLVVVAGEFKTQDPEVFREERDMASRQSPARFRLRPQSSSTPNACALTLPVCLGACGKINSLWQRSSGSNKLGAGTMAPAKWWAGAFLRT